MLEELRGRLGGSSGTTHQFLLTPSVRLGACWDLEQSPNLMGPSSHLTCLISSIPRWPSVGESVSECDYKLPHPGAASPVRPPSCNKTTK